MCSSHRMRSHHAAAFTLHCGAVPAGVPSNAKAAASQIRQSIRTALISGRRRVCVDTLVCAIEPRSRTFDDPAAELVFSALIESVQPLLPDSESSVQVVVSGSAAALRVQKWLARSQFEGVSVDVLGAEERHDARSVVVIEPPTGRGVLQLRKLLREAHGREAHVVVHNQPREDSLYKLLGFGGYLPVEMMRYEPVFVMAPFALQDSEGAWGGRFVVLRQFPGAWQLWQYFGEAPTMLKVDGEGGGDDGDDYKLCQEFRSRPGSDELIQAITNVLG